MKERIRILFVTAPRSNDSFYPIMSLRGNEIVQILNKMKADVATVDMETLSQKTDYVLESIRYFNPTLILSLSLSYLTGVILKNINKNIFNCPIITLWDDPLGALANSLHLIKGYNSMNPLEIFRKILMYPKLVHFSWDTGHMKAVNDIGIVDADRVKWYPLFTYPSFLNAGINARKIPKKTDVAFHGNIYSSMVNKSSFWQNEFLRSLTKKICKRKMQQLDKPLWCLLNEEIEGLPSAQQSKYGLYMDKVPFWQYYVFVVWHAANTVVRTGILSQIKRNVSIYGLFSDPESITSLNKYQNLKYAGNIHHFDELPINHAATKINICINNGLINQGVGSKFIDCIASGGFALTDPKEDLVRIFGKSVEQIFFRNADELNTKIDYYLSRPNEREDIVNELGMKIRQECTIKRFIERYLFVTNNINGYDTLSTIKMDKNFISINSNVIQKLSDNGSVSMFHCWITKLATDQNRLYYRDQTPESLNDLIKLVDKYKPTKIVELGTLSGLSLRTWLSADTDAEIIAIDLSFEALRQSQQIISA